MTERDPARHRGRRRRRSARAGVVHTARGTFATPCFMPVGTRGVGARSSTPADLDDLGAEVVLANTYHLMLRPGADVVDALGGLHRFMGWDGHILTDSGGFQVFSLEPQGRRRGRHLPLDLRRLYPPPDAGGRGGASRQQLGADIQMVLDVCSRPAGPDGGACALAAERTARLGRAGPGRVHRGHDQALFGIVQGGVRPDAAGRAREPRRSSSDFDGYGIGGLSVGEPRDQMLPALRGRAAELPADRPRYLMGVGDPVIASSRRVALGVDMFDCVLPTRLARHGTALTDAGRSGPSGPRTPATTARSTPPAAAGCAPASAAATSGTFCSGEPTAGRLLTIHNLAWLLDLFERIREAIKLGSTSPTHFSASAPWTPDPPHCGDARPAHLIGG